MNPTSSQSDVLAVEKHNGRIWSLIVVLALIVPAISVAMVPTRAARFALAVVGVVGIFTFAMAWSGFEYRFLRHGLEIRMLGFRLRSIPRSAIVNYAVEPWAFIRGYGIRGIGRTRAYAWCNRVVHIKTTNADIFLGHNDPARIVRDLDQMMGLAASG
jgi:hypothetical protein